MDPLPAPEVTRRYLDDSFQPPLPALALRWDLAALGLTERLWYLPQRVCLAGPPPEQFGMAVERRRPDSYTVRLLWDRTSLRWAGLTRAELLTCALAPVLRALGMDLRDLLDRPVKGGLVAPRQVA
jgi:hypothetical protein